MRWRSLSARSVVWAATFAGGLRAFSPYAWVPILIVAVTSVVLAYSNLALQQRGNRPEIIFNRMEMHNPYDDGLFSLGMLNVGTRTAYDYRTIIKTVDLSTWTIADLEVVSSSNPISRQGGISGDPRLDMTKFLDVLALCTTYRDEDGKKFKDVLFVYFPNMTRGLKKDQGGGGQYLAASVSPDDRLKLAKRNVCKD